MTWDYIAGFFDGEGHIRMDIGVNKVRPRVQIGQSGSLGHKLLEEMQTFLAQCGIRTYIYQHKAKARRKEMWVLIVTSRKHVSTFIQNVLPRICIKKPASQDIYRFLCMYPRRHGNG